jgi:hypothetical protein
MTDDEQTDEATGHPDVSGLGESSALALLDHGNDLAGLRSPGVGRWARALIDAIFTRLLNLTGQQPDWITEPVALSTLSEPELRFANEYFVDDRRAFQHDDDAAVWCRQMVRLILVEQDRRQYQNIVDILDRQAWECELVTGVGASTEGIPPWSEVSRPGF